MHKRVKAGKEQPRVNKKVELKKLREPLFGSRDNDNIISLLILILLAYCFRLLKTWSGKCNEV